MEYCWSKKRLEKHENMLKDMLNKETNPKVLKHLQDEIAKINLLITEREKLNLDYTLDNSNLVFASTFDHYNNLSEDLRRIIKESAMQLKNLYVPDFDVDLEYDNHSIEEVFSLCNDFYSKLPNKNLIQFFNYITNPKNHFIRYKNESTCGYTINFLYPKPLSYISLTPDIIEEEFSTINHEIAHAFYCSKDTIDSINNNHFYLVELEGHYFNFLSREYIKKIYGLYSENLLLYTSHCYAYDNIISLFITSIVVDEFIKRGQVEYKRVEDTLCSYNLPISISMDNIYSCVHENFEVNYCYLISFLTSLDIQEMYYKDKEKAFYIFENIRNNKSNDILKNLNNNGITFFKDGYKNLRRELVKFDSL